MQFVIADCKFEGPIVDVVELFNRSGIYFVARMWRGESQILLVQEARLIRDASKIWLPETPAIQPYNIALFVHYTPSLNVIERRCLADTVRDTLSSLMPTLPNLGTESQAETPQLALATVV
jgi:hypothetical protein